ncbi:MAG: M42 family peptidase, partial [Rhodopirellula bahusiensis]
MQPLEFFKQSILTPSPSGYEEPIQKLIGQYLKPHSEEVSIDVHGNLTARVGTAGGPKLMLAGHCDQIGMLISHIDDQGFLYAQTIGGWDPQQLIGQSMTVWTDDGPVSAVIS